MAEREGHRHRRGLDLGRLIAKVLCALFALVGALPLAASLLVRTEPVRRWAAAETARVLEAELGVKASYRVEVHLLPLEVALLDVLVPASDGKSPFLDAERVAVKPRVFSLLAGRLDAGDIEIEKPKTRVVLKDGKLQNLAYRLPEAPGKKQRTKRAPFASVAMSDATIELDVDGIVVRAGPLDLDVLADEGPSFDVGLRAAQTSIVRSRTVKLKPVTPGGPAPEKIAHDDDVICALDARLRFEPGDLLVRRLSLTGMADADPAAATAPSCAAAEHEDEPARVAVRLSQLRARFAADKPTLVDGHAVVRAPAFIANRFVRTLPLAGFIELDAELNWDGTRKLPDLRGSLKGKGIELGRYRLATMLQAELAISEDRILVPKFEMGFADGLVELKNAEIDPFAAGAPIKTERVDGTAIAFSAMMRDLGVTPNTVVSWDLKKTRVTKINGTFDPLKIDAELSAESRDFEVFDRAFHDPHRRHMIGVRGNHTVRGRIGVRPNAFEIYDTRADFGKSSVHTRLVSIGFHNDITLTVAKGSVIQLEDATPLVDIPWKGRAEIELEMKGKANDPLILGTLAVQNLEFGGFPLGEVKSSKVRFQPLKIEFSDVHGRKGKSDYVVSSARLDLDTSATLIADAEMRSERFDLRDFLAMWRFDEDPRFEPIAGDAAVTARVHYDLGGQLDRCGGGFLRVDGSVKSSRLDLFDERYDSGEADFDFRWADRDASYLGFEVDVPSLTLRKGSGTLLGSLSVRHGGELRGHVVGTSLPLSKLDSLGELALLADGRVSAVAEVSGSIDAIEADTSVRVTPVRLGSSTLPASDFQVKLVPIRRELRSVGKTRCGRPIPSAFERGEWERDEAQGIFHLAGQLFGGQVRLSNLEISRQRNKIVRGKVALRDLDVGALSELSPGVALSDSKPGGRLSGQLDLQEMPLEKPAETRAELVLTKLLLSQGGMHVKLEPGAQPITVRDGRLDLHGLALAVKTPRGPQAVFDAQGSVQGLGRAPTVDAVLALRPTELAAFASLIPRAERIKGSLNGKLRVSGSPSALRYRGGLALRDGEMFLRGFPSPITDLELAIDVDNDEVRISRGSARVGAGTIRLTGSAPLRGFELGAARAVVTARELGLPLVDGVRAQLDADLIATWKPPAHASAERPLPHVTGDITMRSFEYTRPVTMTADIASLAQRGRRTSFEAYDPADDFVEFDVTLRANRALVLKNNLIEAELELDRDGLLLAGSNQRFGLRGAVRIKPGGRIRLRQSEFEIRQGFVRFDDLTRVAPQVDVTAVTEYRRYTEATGESGAPDTAGGSSTATSVTGGRWRITMHAYGDADKLRVDLTSEPALAQDDIFLLLTVGLTRAELDQTQSASVGESVALEALGTLTGADRAVKSAVPVIDEFRFGSAYSSRTGRTEPTVTIGKRLAERIRANVTSGLADSREIRSNIEWRLSPRVSVEGSYDNVNDISSSSLGNLGADVRWRLEFE